MLFVEWWAVERFAGLTILSIGPCVAIWLLRKKRKTFKVTAALLGAPIVLLAGLLIADQFLPLGSTDHSAPLYSPDHEKAVRVRTNDDGALGGDTQVELFSHHGFSSTDVYEGGWKSLEMKNVRWIDNQQLEITYDGIIYRCSSTRAVAVHCIQRPNSN